MKLRKLLRLLALAAAICCLAACAAEKAPAETDEPAQPEADANTEAAPQALPVLNSLQIDGGYTIDFDPQVCKYTVTIPAGRPRVPKISAEAADGAAVEVLQATIADTANSGEASATVRSADAENVYTVRFVKDAAKGFELQYADVYEYVADVVPEDGAEFSFESSDPDVISVSETGSMKAKALSDSPVTVTVYFGDEVHETIVVDRVIKAPLNIFLIIGQSNAYGWHDVPPEYADYYSYANEQKSLSDAPKLGTVWCDDIINSYDEYQFSGMYDLSKGRSGFSPALGKEWYNLTGEKTLMLQTAIGSTPIETWMPDPNLKFFGLDCYAQTVERFREYQQAFSAEDSNFEINRVYAFWLQGETCEEYTYSPGTFTWTFKNATPNYDYLGDWLPVSAEHPLMTSEEYANDFISMFEGFKKDVGLEFLGILPVRAMTSVSSAENVAQQQLVDLVPVRAAQFALNYSGAEGYRFVTMQTEIGRTESYPDESAEGWGYMGCYNIHYNQKGYNAIGKDAAENTFARFCAAEDHTAHDITVLDSDGRTQLENGQTLLVPLGQKHQITAYVTPLYAEDTALQFEVADASVCTIDAYGMVQATSDAQNVGKTTELRITGDGVEKTITIQIAR